MRDERQPRAVGFHPAFAGRALYTIEERPNAGADDEANTTQTIARMIEYTKADSQSPIVRRAALAATANASTPRDKAAAIHGWTRRNVRYVEDATLAAGIAADPATAEVLIRPVDLLTMPEPVGDCDDFSMLIGAMLRAVGIDAAFKTVAADASDPRTYSHVYVIAKVDGGPLALDGSHGPVAGWETPAAGKTRLWPIGARTMQGLGFGEGIDSGDWFDLAKVGLTTTGQIMTQRYAVPQMNPGQTYQNASGYYTQAPANGYGYAGYAASQPLNTGWLLIAGVGILAVVLMSRKG